MNDLERFVKIVFPLATLILGLFGNITGLLVIKKKSLKNIGPRSTYVYLFLMDIFYLIQILVPFLQYGFKIDVQTISDLVCRLFNFSNYSLDTQSAMMLAYISFERLISIKYSSKVSILRKEKTQLIYFLAIFIYNLVFYSPIIFFYSLQSYADNSSNINYFCDFTSSNSQLILSNMDLVNRVVIPFFLMTLFTIILIDFIFQSRKRIIKNYSSKQNKTFQKDIKFAVTSIVLNIVYVLFNLPVSIVIFVPNYYLYITYHLFLFLFYSSYAVNFYIILLTNSLVRNEFLIMLGLRNKINSRTTTHAG